MGGKSRLQETEDLWEGAGVPETPPSCVSQCLSLLRNKEMFLLSKEQQGVPLLCGCPTTSVKGCLRYTDPFTAMPTFLVSTHGSWRGGRDQLSRFRRYCIPACSFPGLSGNLEILPGALEALHPLGCTAPWWGVANQHAGRRDSPRDS